MIFWRAGQLIRVDYAGERHVLNSKVGHAGNRILSRVMLSDAGVLVFAIADEDGASLWIGQDLAPLVASSWPCGDGNPSGNPVWR